MQRCLLSASLRRASATSLRRCAQRQSLLPCVHVASSSTPRGYATVASSESSPPACSSSPCSPSSSSSSQSARLSSHQPSFAERAKNARGYASAAAAAAEPAKAAPPPPASDTIDVEVDGHPVTVPKGVTVLQACDVAGVEIPRFCYHQRLSIAGNCRMCLVEVEKSPKPVASCAMPAMPGMKIKTSTPLVKKAREGVMEFLLLNHPLDCPICDQGGECDLQDQAMVYGSDRGRFTGYKRSVEDKNFGPLVKTVMTRCIHCTRCVRYATEVAGVQDLGVTGRGRDSEIGTYIERMLTSEVSGNVIDLCPVGALTSKPFAFTARNWELKSTESIDVTDSIGASIRVDTRGSEVMRILPRLNEEVNEEWITDKARFSYDGLRRQRLIVPMVRSHDGLLEPSNWPDAFNAIAAALHGVSGGEMKAVAGKLADAESMIALKDLMNRLGCTNHVSEGEAVDADIRSQYLFNSRLSGVEEADVCLLVGTDLRSEAPLLNLRLRKAVISGRLKVASIGPAQDLTYAHEHLGTGASALRDLAEGNHEYLSVLKGASRPIVIVGAGLMRRPDKESLLVAVQRITEQARIVRDGWNGYNMLHLSAGRVAALDIGFVPGPQAAENKTPAAKFVYLLGADDIEAGDIAKEAFVVYQGHHGDKGASMANVVLPGAAYTEKEGTYVNTEGRVQMTRPAVPVVGNSRDDWKIIRALSEVLGKRLPYDSVSGVRQRLAEVAPHLSRVDSIEPSVWLNGDALAHYHASALADTPFEKVVDNFYMTDPISRASQTMAKCTAARKKEVAEGRLPHL
ncbi:hypothetical protein CBR_g6354 [Chara braunii]|uniref:Uncharacterized protein n=1 Tax=Chara braunii TaxID=69332 RepID=A0A388KJT0_CHABU|nr:hypothetical protein CBR_g6354 [Chara braunii]|eukprot:GBG70223.1 hypothetical protein CBR_g6354 [Chara braunii]